MTAAQAEALSDESELEVRRRARKRAKRHKTDNPAPGYIEEMRRRGPTPSRSFFNERDMAWRYGVLDNVLRICQDGLELADGGARRLSLGAQDVLLFVTRVKLSMIDFYGQLSAATIAAHHRISVRKAQMAIAELRQLQLVACGRRGRETFGIELAEEIWKFRGRPKVKAPPPPGLKLSTSNSQGGELPASRKNVRAPIYPHQDELFDNPPVPPSRTKGDPSAGGEPLPTDRNGALTGRPASPTAPASGKPTNGMRTATAPRGDNSAPEAAGSPSEPFGVYEIDPNDGRAGIRHRAGCPVCRAPIDRWHYEELWRTTAVTGARRIHLCPGNPWPKESG